MKAVVQRVSRASVSVDGKTVGEINNGFLVLLGVAKGDDRRHADYIAEKLVKLRIFEDENGKMNLNIQQTGGDMLIISQFTLITEKPVGNRPYFGGAEEPDKALPLYEYVCGRVEELLDRPVARGIFGARMEVGLVNNGPVTLVIDSRDRINKNEK